MRKDDPEAVLKAGHERAFKPAKHIRQPTNATYKHMQDTTHIQKNYRCEENPRDVVTAPPNIQTNPPKRGQVGKQTTFGGNIPYMEDDYNRPKALANEELEYHKSKL